MKIFFQKWGRGLRFISGLAVFLTAAVSQASAPSTPNSCPAAAPITVTNATPATIGTLFETVTSTMNVSGANPYLWDLDVQTFIEHSRSSDLYVTLTSPQGTVVTLTSANAQPLVIPNNPSWNQGNVFNGTLWDDDADPDGQVPYALPADSNEGLATDHPYAPTVVATRLAPEEALGAFIGEDPNGTWTLSIYDRALQQGGTLRSWNMRLTALGTAPTFEAPQTFTNTTRVSIPTTVASVINRTNVSGMSSFLCDVNIETAITHTRTDHLDITIASPSGTVVTLSTDNGALSGNANPFYGTLWDDQADPDGYNVPNAAFLNNGHVTDHMYLGLAGPIPTLAPEEGLAAFIGEDPNGDWILTISDDTAGDGGMLSAWNLELTTCSCTADLTVSMGRSSAPVQAGDSIAYDITVNNHSSIPATNVVMTGATPPNTTLVSLEASSLTGWPAGGWNCAKPDAGAGGPISCTNASIPAGAAYSFNLVVAVDAGTAGGTVISNSASVSASQGDTDASNNTASSNLTLVGTVVVPNPIGNPQPPGGGSGSGGGTRSGSAGGGGCSLNAQTGHVSSWMLSALLISGILLTGSIRRLAAKRQ